MKTPNIKQRFGIIMRLARQSQCMSQKQMCKKIHITQGWLSKLENGTAMPRADEWLRFCEAGCVPSYCGYDPHIFHNTSEMLLSSIKAQGIKLRKSK